MPVLQTTRVNRYTGNGIATVFAYQFRILDKTHIKVTIDGATKTVDVDYTVSGVGAAAGGNITFTTPPANGTSIVLIGNAPYARSTDYVRNGNFQEETVDADFDLAIILIQQLVERFARIPSLVEGSAYSNISLPDPVAERFLRWKSDLSGLENIDIASIGTLAVSDFAKTFLDDPDAISVLSTLGISPIDKTLIDAKGDLIVGTAADTAARKAVGTDGQILLADSFQPDGLRWADQLGGFKNKLINGNFDVWQRGTTQSAPAVNGYGSDDRWANSVGGSSAVFSQQAFAAGQTDVPGNPAYFARIVVTSVAGASNYVQKSQKIENVRTLAGKTATLSFYAKADAARNLAVEFTQEFGSGGSPSAVVAGIGSTKFALTTAWQKFTLTVNIPSISGKTLGTNNNHFLRLNFWFDAGSNYDSRTVSLGQQSGIFDIAQVQLEEGSVATAFEQRPIGVELALCQRYYYETAEFIGAVDGSNTAQVIGNVSLPGMRTAPTYSPTSSFTIKQMSQAGPIDRSTTTNSGGAYVTTPTNANLVIIGFPAMTGGDLVLALDSTNKLKFSAEL